MRPSSRRIPSSRRLTFLFAVVLLPPAVALVWLGVTLLAQDRTMMGQRAGERREAAAEIITRSLLQSLNEAEGWLIGDGRKIPDGAVRFTRSSSGSDVTPSRSVLWVPAPTPIREVASAPFADAERAEIEGTGDRGLEVYQSLASSTDPAVRAGALIRLARVHRRNARVEQALRAYRDLASIGDIAINRTPVDLVARRMIDEILTEAGRKDEATHETASLSRDLLAGRWPLDRAAWDIAAADVARFGAVLPAARDRETLSLALDWVNARPGTFAASGRRTLVIGDVPVTMAWQTSGPDFRVVLVAPSVVEAWMRAALGRDLPASVRTSLVTDDGRLVAGEPSQAGGRPVQRSALESGLPWTVSVGPGDAAQADAETAGRRRVLIAGLVALVAFLAGGSYLLWRVVRRELAVAKLQTDFVAAVSHEFRTPLTSLRHITGLLEESDDLPPGRRQSLYGVLSQSTERLHRLVESTLDFARMEDGRRPWTLRPLDPSELVADVVTSFRRERAGVAIDVDIPAATTVSVEADTDALTHALWNLLDNAVKYSPDGGTIRVSMREEASGVAIAVTDTGLGIPDDERQRIFQRFVRGRRAAEHGIAGTGLGLAMVSHIVSAHGGRIDVQSQEGHGSTFTIVLPAAA